MTLEELLAAFEGATTDDELFATWDALFNAIMDNLFERKAA